MIAIILSLAAIIVSVVALLKRKDPQVKKNTNRIKFVADQVDVLYEITPKAERNEKEIILTFQDDVIYSTEQKKKT